MKKICCIVLCVLILLSTLHIVNAYCAYDPQVTITENENKLDIEIDNLDCNGFFSIINKGDDLSVYAVRGNLISINDLNNKDNMTMVEHENVLLCLSWFPIIDWDKEEIEPARSPKQCESMDLLKGEELHLFRIQGDWELFTDKGIIKGHTEYFLSSKKKTKPYPYNKVFTIIWQLSLLIVGIGIAVFIFNYFFKHIDKLYNRLLMQEINKYISKIALGIFIGIIVGVVAYVIIIWIMPNNQTLSESQMLDLKEFQECKDMTYEFSRLECYKSLYNCTQVEECFVQKAFDLDNMQMCDALSDFSIRDIWSSECYVNFALNESNPQICNGATSRDACLFLYAMKTKDDSLCDIIGSTNEDILRKTMPGGGGSLGYHSIPRATLKEKCFIELVNSTQMNLSICNKFTSKYYINRCYQQVAINTNNISICDLINYSRCIGRENQYCGGPISKTYCKLMVEKDFSKCKFLDEKHKKDCVWELAPLTRNVSVCLSLESDFYRGHCIKEMAFLMNDTSICDFLDDGSWNHECRDKVASKLNDISLCSTTLCSIILTKRLAVMKKDPSICERIPLTEFDNKLCYREIALTLNDPSICDKIKGNQTYIEDFKTDCKNLKEIPFRDPI